MVRGPVDRPNGLGPWPTVDPVYTPSLGFNLDRWRLIGRPRKRRTAPPAESRR